jgi:hypothetical protein
MAGERTVVVGLWRVTGHSSRIRRILFDLFPFWQGATPSFELTIEATTNIEHSQDFLYSVQFSYHNIDPPDQLQIPPMKANEIRKYKLVPMPLIYTGDSFLVVAEVIKNQTEPYYQTVYCFHTTARSWLGLAILAGLLSGIIAAFVNWILSLI